MKKRYPVKSRYFTVVGQSFVKTVADRHVHAAIQRLTRIGFIRGSGRVWSRVRPTFYRIFLCVIFYHLYSYCCHLIGQDIVDQRVWFKIR